ncbi:acyl-CoA dehydrogenase family protein [Xanthobacter sp. DSM 24535]|uniref:acyl-CoA dehydrogenase family protein n=1 Tax=Roseixanthobacter psychrophilus TaxID=3119917 RepID=UPI003727D552
MDFTLPPHIEAVRARTRTFVADHILPLEADRANYDAHDNIAEPVLERVRAKARAEGLWAPQTPQALGGMGIGMVGQAAMYEEANRSIFGPACFNAAAPDDGNMMLMAKVATPEQQAWWLKPVVAGEMRSAFAMTEPNPGSGSDPGMMLTRAEKRGDRYVITGRKWFITGAEAAGRFIVMARTSDDPRTGLTAFLFDAKATGWRIERRIEIMGPEEHGGHCELIFDGLEIPAEHVLMKEGDGLRVTQIRLGPARLTHCMRWLGLSKRALEIGHAYASERTGFGIRLADRESVQIKLGKAASAIEVGRLLVMKAAWLLDAGDKARKEVSMAKNHVAETLHLCADTALQLCGAKGYSKDTPLEWIYRYARQAKLVDGASEVHDMVLAGFYAKEGQDFWRWGSPHGK